jgi:hypothetical protein
MFNNLSFTGYVLSFKNEAFNLSLPKFLLSFINMSYWIIWKINIKKLLSKTCFIKFKIKEPAEDVTVSLTDSLSLFVYIVC